MNAPATIRAWWNNTKELPFPIGTFCQGGMVAGPITLAFLALPIMDWTINDREMSYGELWTSGAGLVAALFVLLVMVGAWGLAARNRTSRWALVAAPIAPYIAAIPFPRSGLITPDDLLFVILSGLFTAAVIYGCLFHLPGVRRYLSSTAVDS